MKITKHWKTTPNYRTPYFLVSPYDSCYFDWVRHVFILFSYFCYRPLDGVASPSFPPHKYHRNIIELSVISWKDIELKPCGRARPKYYEIHIIFSFLVSPFIPFLSVYLLTYLLVYLLTYLLTYVFTCLLIYLFAYLLIHSFIHLLIYLRIYLLTYLFTYLFAYLLP